MKILITGDETLDETQRAIDGAAEYSALTGAASVEASVETRGGFRVIAYCDPDDASRPASLQQITFPA